MQHRLVMRRSAEGALGYGYVLRHEAMPANQALAWLATDPDVRRLGWGGRLWSEILSLSAAAGVSSLLSKVRDDDPDSLTWAVRRGFSVTRRKVHLELRLADFPEERADRLVESCTAEGVRFATLGELGDDPRRRRELHRLEAGVAREIPGLPAVPATFAAYQETCLSSRRHRADGVILALRRGRMVGVTRLGLDPSGERMTHEITGVLPEHRGQGIAKALKGLAIRRARRLGAAVLETSNDSRNAPILALNESLGFLRTPGWLVLRRDGRGQ